MNLSSILVAVAAIVFASADPIRKHSSEPHHGFVTIPKILPDAGHDEYAFGPEFYRGRDALHPFEHKLRPRQGGSIEEFPTALRSPPPPPFDARILHHGRRGLQRPQHKPRADKHISRRDKSKRCSSRSDAKSEALSRKRRVDDRMYAARTECGLRMGNKHSKKRDDAKTSRYYLVDGKDARYGKSRSNKHHLKAKSERAPCTHKRSSSKSDDKDDDKVDAKRIDKMDHKVEDVANKLWKFGTSLRSFAKISGEDTILASKSDDKGKDDKSDVDSKKKSDDKKSDEKRTDAKSEDEPVDYAVSSAVKRDDASTRAKRHADKFGVYSKAALKRQDVDDDDDDDKDTALKRHDVDDDDDDDKKRQDDGDDDGDDTVTRHDGDDDDQAKIEYKRKYIYKRRDGSDEDDEKTRHDDGDDDDDEDGAAKRDEGDDKDDDEAAKREGDGDGDDDDDQANSAKIEYKRKHISKRRDGSGEDDEKTRHDDGDDDDDKVDAAKREGDGDGDDDDDQAKMEYKRKYIYKRRDGSDEDDEKTRHDDGDDDDDEVDAAKRAEDDDDDDIAKIEFARKRIYKRQGDGDDEASDAKFDHKRRDGSDEKLRQDVSDGDEYDDVDGAKRQDDGDDDDDDDKEARTGGDDHKAASARRGKRHAIVPPTPLKIYKHKNLRRSGRDVSKSRSKRAIIQQDQYFIVHPQAEDDGFHMNAKSIANKRLDAAQKMYDNMQLKYRDEDDMLKTLRDELGLHYDDRDVTLERRDDVTFERDDDVTFERDDDVTFERDDDVTFERDDDVTFERDDDVTFERDDVTLERDDVTLERDDVTLERDDVTLERDDVTLERDDVTLERVDKSTKKARGGAKLKPRRDLFVKDKRHEDILLRRG